MRHRIPVRDDVYLERYDRCTIHSTYLLDCIDQSAATLSKIESDPYPLNVTGKLLQSNAIDDVGPRFLWSSRDEDKRVCAMSIEQLHDAVVAE